MIEYELLTDDNVVVVTPDGRLEANDFKQLAAAVDPLIEKNGKLNGLMIRAESFPGWKNFAGLLSHLRFVRDHHRNIAKVALVSDSEAAIVAETAAKHFVKAKIRHFDFENKTQALAWLKQAE